jgi:hypothetical protein
MKFDPNVVLEKVAWAGRAGSTAGPGVLELLTRCLDMLRERQYEPLTAALGSLGDALDDGAADTGVKRRRHRRTIDRLGLLAEHPDLSGSLATYFYATLLQLMYGTQLAETEAREVLGRFNAAPPPPALLDALTMMRRPPDTT